MTITTQHVRDYLERSIASFVGDPPDSAYLRGYLAALETVRDDLFKTDEERAANFAKRWGRP